MARNVFMRTTGLLLCVSMAGTLLSGCKKGDDMFPSIDPYSNGSDVTEETAETDETVVITDIEELSVALPYSDLTVQCLASMFYCKNNGLWESNESGITVDADYLTSIATNYAVTNIGCGSTGASLENIDSWNEGGNMPDLFLAQDSKAVWDSGYCAELNSFLSDDTYLSSQQIYSGALTADSENGIFFAVPHFCSAEIIIGSKEFIPSGSGKLQTKNTTEELREYLFEIREEYPDCAGFASAYNMIPYLGSAFNGDIPTSFMGYDEYLKNPDSAKAVIADASSYVRNFYFDSIANDLSAGADPVYSRTAALWADSSANIKAWDEYYPNSLYFLHLPCNDASNVGVPYVSTYSLCVSKGSANSKFAAEFATFISYDPDAQLLIYRLENMTGLMPLTRNDSVWDLISDDPLFGHMAADFHQTMDNAVYCPASYDSKVFTNTKVYTAEFVKGTDDFDPEKCYG